MFYVLDSFNTFWSMRSEIQFKNMRAAICVNICKMYLYTGLIEQRKCAEPADFLGGSRYEPTTAWLFRPAYSKTFNKDEWPVH